MEAKYARNTYFLVRHGEAENNVLHLLNSSGSRVVYSLTERGQQQVMETAQWLKPYQPDFVVTSPILRAIQTAEIIHQTLDLPLSHDERLVEAHFGTFEDTPIQPFLEYMQVHGTRAIGAPELGVEGYMDIRERVRSFLESTAAAFQGKKIVIVSHADPLQEIYAELLGEPIGAEQGAGQWFPEKGSCLIIDSQGKGEHFNPR